MAESEDQTKGELSDHLRERAMVMGEMHYQRELIRIVTMLFTGLLALMAFLLAVGLQKPHQMFQWALYSSLVLLPLNLLVYVIGHALVAGAKPGKEAGKMGMMVRITQQVVFILAVLAVSWTAYEAAQFFFSVAPAAAGGGAPPQ